MVCFCLRAAAHVKRHGLRRSPPAFVLNRTLYLDGVSPPFEIDWRIVRRVSHPLGTGDQRLQLSYTYLGSKYHVCYTSWEAVKFPPYTVQELQKPQGFPCRMLSAHMTLADGSDTDVTDLLLRYAGPRGDFYKGRAAEIKMGWLFNHLQMKHVPRVVLTVRDTWQNVEQFACNDVVGLSHDQ